jgi:hypothetical protein
LYSSPFALQEEHRPSAAKRAGGERRSIAQTITIEAESKSITIKKSGTFVKGLSFFKKAGFENFQILSFGN